MKGNFNKTIKFVSITFIVAFLIFIFWGVFFAKREIFNENKLDILVSIFTIIGITFTVATIAIAKKSLDSGIKQLEEMKLQRLHSQQPDIFLEHIPLSVDYESQIVYFNAPWKNGKSDINRKNPLNLEIVNIGNGVAKNIGIEIYLEEEYLSQIVEADEKDIFNIEISDTDYGYTFFQYSHGEMYKEHSSSNYDVSRKFHSNYNYLNPNDKTQICLDYKIFQILNMHLFLNASNLMTDKMYYYPRFKFVLSYEDSFGNKYRKETDVIINITSTNLKTTDEWKENNIEAFFDLTPLNKAAEIKILI